MDDDDLTGAVYLVVVIDTFEADYVRAAFVDEATARAYLDAIPPSRWNGYALDRWQGESEERLVEVKPCREAPP